METRTLRSRAVRLGAVAVMALASIGGAVTVNPSSASAACGGTVYEMEAAGQRVYVRLKTTSTCLFYTTITIDDYRPDVGQSWSIRVERQVNGTYGWQTTHNPSETWAGGWEGTRGTPTVPNSSVDDDRFRACYHRNSAAWTCGRWAY